MEQKETMSSSFVRDVASGCLLSSAIMQLLGNWFVVHYMCCGSYELEQSHCGYLSDENKHSMYKKNKTFEFTFQEADFEKDRCS